MKEVIKAGKRTATTDDTNKQLWEVSGLEQFELLVSVGLKPHHKLLDVGCGAMRGGIHFIKYLGIGNYYGFDKEKNLIDCGLIEIELMNLKYKVPHLYHITDFNLDGIYVKFDYMLALSVFSHIDADLIEKCLRAIKPLLADQGKFYFTYHETKECDIVVGKPHTWRKTGIEYDKIEYSKENLARIASKVGLRFVSIDEIQNKHDPSTYQNVAYMELI